MKADEWGFLTRISRSIDDLKKKRSNEWVARGESLLTERAMEKAVKCFKKSLSLDSKNSAAYTLMTRALMPHDDYLANISRFHSAIRPESYVEIGVATGKSLSRVQAETKAIGIDPGMREGIETHAKLFRMRSDDFFERHNLLEELGAPKLSLGFIDGLHLFEQVLRDFINLERYSEKKTIILIHDCLPASRVAASRKRATPYWCGDVWKIIPKLCEHRPDLRIFVIPTRPSGLGVITNLDSDSTVLVERYSHIIASCQSQELEYEYLDFEIFEDLKSKFRIVPNDWDYIVQNVLRTV